MKPVFSQNILEKYTNIKFHENPSTGSRVDSCGRTDGPTDMMNVIVASRNFANAPKTSPFIKLEKALKLKFKIKIDTEFAPTCFGLRPSSGSLRWSPAKVILC
jgi:hypothetical protein